MQRANIVLITVLTLPWLYTYLAAEELFVSNVCGDDATGDGSRLKPYATIRMAHDNAKSRDVIRVLPSGDLSNACPPLTAYANTRISKDLCIVAEAGPLETRSGGFVIDPDVTATIRGFMIMNPGGEGCLVSAGMWDSDNKLDLNSVENLCTIENCVFEECAKSGVKVINNPLDGHFRLWVKNCVIIRCGGDGVQLFLDKRGCLSQEGCGLVPGITIENTLLSDNLGPAVDVLPDGVNFGVGGNQMTIRYCYLQNNNSGGEQVHANAAARKLIVSSNEITNPPIFRNPGLCDFRLVPASTLRHKGNPNCLYLNPDGTLNDPGAFGGPGSLGSYPQSGPIILQTEILPGSRPGTVQVRVLVK